MTMDTADRLMTVTELAEMLGVVVPVNSRSVSIVCCVGLRMSNYETRQSRT